MISDACLWKRVSGKAKSAALVTITGATATTATMSSRSVRRSASLRIEKFCRVVIGQIFCGCVSSSCLKTQMVLISDWFSQICPGGGARANRFERLLSFAE